MNIKIFYLTVTTLLIFAISENILPKDIISLNENESVKFTVSKVVNANYSDEEFVKEEENNFLTKNIEVFANSSENVSLKFDLLGIPFKTVEVNANEISKVYPSGDAVAIKMNTEGVLVLNIGSVNDTEGKILKPSKDKLKVGDIIYKVDDVDIENKEQLSEIIENSDGDLIFTIKEGEEIKKISITPCKSIEDEKYKIGVWVRDSTQGIGTVTFVSEDKNNFYALGHGILDIDTKELMTVKNGEASTTEIISIEKGKKGVPGELIGEIKTGEVFGTIDENRENGVKGTLEEDYRESLTSELELVEVGRKEEVLIGPATILTNIDSEMVKSYDIFIDKIDIHKDSSKSITLTITDKELLEKTGGIVQGMSGSPIIQNGKIVGAVTHVFVQDPKRGYGIFIEDMF